MQYQLENATKEHLTLLIKYKKKSILEYANNLPQEEIVKINNYINSQVPNQLKDYKIITAENKIIGCILVEKYLDGIILDEIYIEKEYRNKKIGTRIIKNIISEKDIVYLWVYKKNKKAYRLYEKLGFIIIEDTEMRYFMKYSN